MSDVKISQLPYVGKTGYTPTDIVPFVSYINPTGTTSETKIDDLKNYILENSVTNNTITVALTGSTGVDFNKIKDAVNSITGATSTNTYTVKVYGGIYNEDPFTIPSWVAVVGDSSISTIIQANDPSQTLIKLSDQSALFDCQVQGCTDVGVSAIIYSSSTTPQSAAISYVENVRFGSNYTHAKVVSSGGANIIMQCSNVKYGGYPFTIGFYATNDGSGVGRMQLRNVTSTNGGVVSTSGLIFAKADAPSCGFIVNGCLLTKATAGGAAGTGFYVENGGFLRLTSVNFQRWSVGIDAPQIGSAPSIDAIALNFENNTIDVNIAHSGATGKIQGTDNFLKTIINQNSPLYEVNQDPKEITVAKKGGDFSSIKSAVDYLISSGNTSSTNRYVISVGPGEFTENEIDLTQTPYVSIVGSNIQTTLIKPSTNTQNIINIGINNEISFLTLSGASAGYAGIYCYDIGDFAQAHKVSIIDCDTGIWVESNTQDTKFYGEYVDYNGTYTYGTKVIGNNGYEALANMENYYNFPSGGNITYCNYASGSGATLSVFVADNQGNGVSGSTAYFVQDGAGLYCSTITIDGFTYGIRNPNVGDPIRFDIDNASIVSGEWDIYVERLGTFGTFGGSSSHEKVYSVSEDVYWSFLDIDDGEFDITRKLSVTFKDGTHTDLSTLLFETGTMGVLEGGIITIVSGTTISISEGYGYVESIINNGVIKRFDWNDTLKVLPQDSNQYLFINNNGILSNSGLSPNSTYNVVLGRVVTNSTDIVLIDASPLNANHTSNQYSNLFRNGLGPIYSKGSIVTENLTPYNIDVTGGDYYYATNEFYPDGGNGITFTMYYRDGGSGWSTSATTQVVVGYDDNSGTISPLTISAFTKHTLYVVGDSVNEQYFLVLGQNEYPTLIQAENALLPLPPTYFSDSVTEIASIYVQQGASNIYQIEDVRPVVGFKAGGVNASSVHGNLLGLSADDHTQYLLVDGSRAMVGDIDMGGNDIYSANSISSTVISATTYQNLPIDPNTYTTGFTYNKNTFTIKQNNGQPNLTATINTVTGMTVNGNLTVTGDTSLDTLSATTISATTYQNLPIDPNTYTTGYTYSDNTFTIKQNNGQPDLTATINTVTGMTVNGNLIITGDTSSQGKITLTSQNVPPSPSVTTPFIDDYTRGTLSPGGTPSLTYTNTNTGTGNSTIVTNYLNISNGGVAGQSYTTVPLSGFGSPFNPTLSSNSTLSIIEWTFNLRTNRATTFTGFGAGTYGGAVVLVGSNTNIQSAGSGYALIYGGTGTRNWKLVKYNNGLAGTQTDVISGGIFAAGTNYVSARIVYAPLTNTWTYYFRDDGAVAWGDPTTTSTLIGTAVDSTYTSTLMSVFGVFFNYSTAASQNLQFDNLRVQQSISPVFTPVDEIIVKNYLGTDVFKVKDDGSITTSGSVTSTGGFFGTFSGTHTGDGSALVLGQSGIMIGGTAQLNLTSATTALTLIPGLSTTITVGTQTMVYIQTNGGVNTLATTTVGGTALDVAILVDGAVLATGGYQRMYADNPTGVGAGNVTNWVANWNTSVILTLSAGTHTIEVDAVFVQGSSASVSGIPGSIKQGTLTVMVLKNI